ncbi:MAG: CBS domain-containing protein [Candidatus Aramenus sp.]|jgi:CBS domain-containing protein|nr:CBS domain-containing protein [Candidatus Aramenus sp.]
MTSKVKYLITKPPVTVQKGTPIREAVRLMASINIGSVVVLDGEKLMGIVTERDVIRALAKGISLDEPVEKIGTTGRLVTVSEDDSVYLAAEKFSAYGIRHLIVTDSDGKFVGVISIRDLIRESHVLKALSTISEEEFTGSD